MEGVDIDEGGGEICCMRVVHGSSCKVEDYDGISWVRELMGVMAGPIGEGEDGWAKVGVFGASGFCGRPIGSR